MPISIDITGGFVDHRAANFDDGVTNRICTVTTGGLGFLPHNEALYMTNDPDDVTDEMYSVVVPKDAIDAAWNDNADSEIGARIAFQCQLSGKAGHLVRDDGNKAFPGSWAVEIDGQQVAFFDHEAVGMLRGEKSVMAEQDCGAYGGEVGLEELLARLMGGDVEID